MAVVCLTLLLPRFGVLGAAWAIVIVQFAPGAFLAAKLPRELGIGLKFLLLPTRADWDFVRVRLNAFVNGIEAGRPAGPPGCRRPRLCEERRSRHDKLCRAATFKT